LSCDTNGVASESLCFNKEKASRSFKNISLQVHSVTLLILGGNRRRKSPVVW